jgi:magnesium-transporting ATPase (P-type)
MVTFFLIAYLLIGIAQIWAGIEGMQLYFGISSVLSVILLFVAYAIPLVGTIGVAFLTYYGAHYGWKWEWWQALMLAVPGIILMLAAAVPVCLAIWAQRLGWLISLHHHLAAGDKDGQQST